MASTQNQLAWGFYIRDHMCLWKDSHDNCISDAYTWDH